MNPPDANQPAPARLALWENASARARQSRFAKMSRGGRRFRRTCLGMLRAGGGVILIAIVLSTTRQATSPAPLHSEVIREAAPDPSVPRPAERVKQYAWLSKEARRTYVPLYDRIREPVGFTRVKLAPGGFGDWLRYLPVAPEGTPVTTAKRQVVLPPDDPALAAAIALQPSGQRLLTAANMVIRLRGEYCWAAGVADRIGFHFTSGHFFDWRSWADGVRAEVKGRNVTLNRTTLVDESRSNFCCYLETIFRYATVYSLYKDTQPAGDSAIEAGDVLIKLGQPGHAVMVLDVATDDAGHVIALLGQGGTPAQTFHVVRCSAGSPWFPIAYSQPIDLGKRGVFQVKDLRHWAN